MLNSNFGMSYFNDIKPSFPHNFFLPPNNRCELSTLISEETLGRQILIPRPIDPNNQHKDSQNIQEKEEESILSTLPFNCRLPPLPPLNNHRNSFTIEENHKNTQETIKTNSPPKSGAPNVNSHVVSTIPQTLPEAPSFSKVLPHNFENGEQQTLSFYEKLIHHLKDHRLKMLVKEGENWNKSSRKENLIYCRKILKDLAFYYCYDSPELLKEDRKSSQQPKHQITSEGTDEFACPCCEVKFCAPPKNSKKGIRGRKRKIPNATTEFYCDPISSCKKHIGSEHYPIICVACAFPQQLLSISYKKATDLKSQNQSSPNISYCQSLLFGSSSNEEGSQIEFWVGANASLSKKKDQERCDFATIQTFVDHLLSVHFRSSIASKKRRPSEEKHRV